MEIPLDHNFPTPILECLQDFIPDINLVPLNAIDPTLPDLDDRDLVISLHQLGYTGFVTVNYKMLQNPRELAAVLKTKMSVFAIEGVGDDPIRATGALLLDLPSAVNAVETGGSRGVFWLRPRRPRPQDPWTLFRKIAHNRNESPSDLYATVKVSDEEMADRKI